MSELSSFVVPDEARGQRLDHFLAEPVDRLLDELEQEVGEHQNDDDVEILYPGEAIGVLVDDKVFNHLVTNIHRIRKVA